MGPIAEKEVELFKYLTGKEHSRLFAFLLQLLGKFQEDKNNLIFAFLKFSR